MRIQYYKISDNYNYFNLLKHNKLNVKNYLFYNYNITFPYFEKSCFKSVALVIDDKPLTQILRTKDVLFFLAKIN